ncbi:hypothetical protein MTO96_043088 [Rhipicephalus appendiculatus]
MTTAGRVPRYAAACLSVCTAALWSLASRVVAAAWEELLERFLRLTLGALVATASLVEEFSLAGCVASAVFRNFRAAVVAMALGASGFPDTPLAGRLRGRLTGEASLEGPAVLSPAAAWRLACQAFGGPRLASACFFAMVSSLRVSIPRQPSIPNSSLCSSTFPLEGKRAPGGRIWCNSGENAD